MLGTSSLAKKGRRGLNLGDYPDWILTLFFVWILASSRSSSTALYSLPLFVSLLFSHIRGVIQALSWVPTSSSSRPQAWLSLTCSSSAVTGMVLAQGCRQASLIVNVLGLTQDFRLKLWVYCLMAMGSWPSRSCVWVPWCDSGHAGLSGLWRGWCDRGSAVLTLVPPSQVFLDLEVMYELQLFHFCRKWTSFCLVAL